MVARKALLVGIVSVVVAAIVVGYALSPYFTQKTVIESLPPDAVMTPDAGIAGAGDDGMAFYAGTFVGVGDGIHDAQGDAYTVALGDGGNILRLENFEATNGPGLRVYLSVDYDADDYVRLGDLKANRGDQNYDIPDGTDLQRYNKVLIWCEPFSVLFGSADLEPLR